MATLLKWAQNTQGKLNMKNNSNGSSERKWIHPPETLQKGHIAYLVKFLGNTVVDQPKGIDVVKEAIRKLRFTQQIKKSESGAKTRKVELTVSVDGVAIQEPRTHIILHQFPLHRISYCADDKSEKRFFSFIAKQPNQVDNDAEDMHECFVFISDKLAEEITLTIGQAFELAYKRFLETSGKDLKWQKRTVLYQQKIKRLEEENNIYKQRLLYLSNLGSIKPDLDQYLRRHDIKNILELPQSTNGSTASLKSNEQTNGNSVELLDFGNDVSNGTAPPVPPRNFDSTPSVGTKLEGLHLDEFEQDNDFDPRSFETSNHDSFSNPNGNLPKAPLIAPPPKATKRSNLNNSIDSPSNESPWSKNSSTPNSASSGKLSDPFEMGDFAELPTTLEFENAIEMLDKKILNMLEIKNGFSRGISFGNEDFSLEMLDPLKN